MASGTGLAEGKSLSVVFGLAVAALALLGASFACAAATTAPVTAASTSTLASAAAVLLKSKLEAAGYTVLMISRPGMTIAHISQVFFSKAC